VKKGCLRFVLLSYFVYHKILAKYNCEQRFPLEQTSLRDLINMDTLDPHLNSEVDFISTFKIHSMWKKHNSSFWIAMKPTQKGRGKLKRTWQLINLKNEESTHVLIRDLIFIGGYWWLFLFVYSLTFWGAIHRG
jgi:hypothetical protein